jgi:hypothetical protein
VNSEEVNNKFNSWVIRVKLFLIIHDTELHDKGKNKNNSGAWDRFKESQLILTNYICWVREDHFDTLNQL